MENRRDFLYMLGAMGMASSAIAPVSSPGDEPSSDSLQIAVKSKAAPVRTLDFADDVFRDLESLGAAIRSAKLVQVGEPSHARNWPMKSASDGTPFDTRTRHCSGASAQNSR